MQVNGKIRGTIHLPKDSDQDAAEVKGLLLDGVKNAVADKSIKKVIFVPNRILNIVV